MYYFFIYLLDSPKKDIFDSVLQKLQISVGNNNYADDNDDKDLFELTAHPAPPPSPASVILSDCDDDNDKHDGNDNNDCVDILKCVNKIIVIFCLMIFV